MKKRIWKRRRKEDAFDLRVTVFWCQSVGGELASSGSRYETTPDMTYPTLLAE